MAPQIFPTTAENIISVIDAVLTLPSGCDLAYVTQFLDIPQDTAQNALLMAKELGLIQIDLATNMYLPLEPFAVYLVTGRDSQRAATLRISLEKYRPYQSFKTRLEVTGLASRAAEQVKAMYNLTPHRELIKDTLISLGTYTQSLVSEGAGIFKPAEFDYMHADCIAIVSEAAVSREQAEMVVRRRLTEEVAGWISYDEVISPLTTAYQKISQGNDCKAAVMFAGNAIESFLAQLGNHFNVNLAGINGINAKAERLGANIKTKQKNMLKYLGHIRNAADHGADAEIGATWDISDYTSIEYTHVAISTIKSITIAIISNRYIL